MWLILASMVRHTAILLLFVTGAALILSTIYLILTRIFTKAIMHITLILSILLNVYVQMPLKLNPTPMPT